MLIQRCHSDSTCARAHERTIWPATGRWYQQTFVSMPVYLGAAFKNSCCLIAALIMLPFGPIVGWGWRRADRQAVARFGACEYHEHGRAEDANHDF